MSRYPSIPEFNDPDSMMDTVRRMKEIVEQLAGQTRSSAQGAPLVFVQPNRPGPEENSRLKVGDFWINTAAGPSLYFWAGSQWQAVSQ